MIQMVLKDKKQLEEIKKQISSNDLLNTLQLTPIPKMEYKDFLAEQPNPLLEQSHELANMFKPIRSNRQKSRRQLQLPHLKNSKSKKGIKKSKSLKTLEIKMARRKTTFNDIGDKLHSAKNCKRRKSVQVPTHYITKGRMFSCQEFDKYEEHNSTATFGQDQEKKDLENDIKFITFHNPLLSLEGNQKTNNADINLRNSDVETQIIKCFQKYIKLPIQKGTGILPTSVVDTTIDLLYAFFLKKKQKELITYRHICLLVYYYYWFQSSNDKKITQLKFKKFVQSVKAHKDHKLKINVFAQFLGIAKPLSYQQFLFYLFGLKFINSNKANASFASLTTIFKKKKKPSFGGGKIGGKCFKGILSKASKSVADQLKSATVTPIGLFYLTKYLYEGKLSYAELRVQIEQLKTCFFQEKTYGVQYQQINSELRTFQAIYSNTVRKFLREIFEIMNILDERECKKDLMYFVLNRYDRSYFTPKTMDELFSEVTIRKAGKFRKVVGSGITQDVFCTILLGSKLMNKRTIQLFLEKGMHIFEEFKSFTEIWENVDEKFIELIHESEQLISIFIKKSTDFAIKYQQSDNEILRRKSLIIFKLLS